ncbi:hypothetical protein B4117_5846 [Bacillus mycoides]|nr:hypothetical protein B4117_5846 [Bacillus mycoides]
MVGWMMNKNNRSQRILKLLEANRKKHKPTPSPFSKMYPTA